MRSLHLLLLVACTSPTAAAQTLDEFLDPAFGDGGTVTAVFPGTPHDAAVSGSGRIIVAASDPAFGFHVARFLPDGTPDAAFGSGGLVSVPYPDAYANPDDLNNLTLALQPGGQVVIATRRTVGDAVAGLLFQLTRDGDLDADFGEAGWLLLDTAVTDVERMPDGRLLVALQGEAATDPDAARFHPDGSPDETFGDSGFSDLSADLPGFRAFAFTPSADFLGRHRLVGTTTEGHPLLADLTNAGALDTQYNGLGYTVDSLRQTDQIADAVLDVYRRTVVLYRAEAMGLNRMLGIVDPGFGDEGFVGIGEEGAAPGAVTVLPDGGILTVADNSIALLNADGHPDPDFGDDGWLPSGWNSLAPQPDAKVVLTGGSAGAWEIARLDFAPIPGSEALDPSFGSGGVVSVELGGLWEWVRASIEMEDGSLLSAGTVMQGTIEEPAYHLALVRTHPDGTLAPAFGDDGRVLLPLDPSSNYAHVVDAARTPEGGVLTAGVIRSKSMNEDLWLTKFTSDGNLDPEFGDGGVVRLDFGPGDAATSIIVSPDGAFIVAAAVQDGNALLRFLPNGSLDPAFGDGGVGEIIHNFGFGNLTPLASGKFLVSGGTGTPKLARFDESGSLDRTFGEEGTVALGGFGWFGNAVELPDGRLAAGAFFYPDTETSLIARFTPDGDLDPSFGEGGIVQIELADPTMKIDHAPALQLLPDGRLIAAGSGNRDYYTMMFAYASRYTADGALDVSFGEEGFLLLDLTAGQEYAYGFRFLMDGQALLTGGTGTVNRDLLLVKFDPGESSVVNEPGAAPETLAFEVYPNPARDAVTIAFDMPEAGTLTAEVFDLLGRRVAGLANGPHTVGRHTLRWVTASLPSGVYVLRLSTPEAVHTRRLTLVR